MELFVNENTTMLMWKSVYNNRYACTYYTLITSKSMARSEHLFWEIFEYVNFNGNKNSLYEFNNSIINNLKHFNL